MQDGMIKLIYSSAFEPSMDISMHVVEDPDTITKKASTIFGCDYSDLKPDDDHVGIHVTALGSHERYGCNRNFDAWTKKACQQYHDTFVKHGHVYRHHRNKDPQKALGSIKASAYNDEMDRVELFIHANKEKCSDELRRLEKEGEIPFSMACKVAYDRCSICGQHRKNSKDPNQCEHIAEKFGEMMDDGRQVFTFNDEPQFFDISFVGRPADRIAWNLKVASAGERIDSIKLAEQAEIWVPDHLAISSASALRKLEHMRKIASFEQMYRKLEQNGARTPAERYIWELRKSAASTLDDATIKALRLCEPADVFNALADAGTVMDARAFYKYAFGLDNASVREHIPAAVRMTQSIFSKLAEDGECQTVCNDVTFDVDTSKRNVSVPVSIVKRASIDAGFIGDVRDERVIDVTMDNRNIKIAVDKSREKGSNDNHTAMVLASKYAAYKLSAVEAIVGKHPDTDIDTALAGLAAQNLVVTEE